MARFSRGSQINDNARQASREQRLRQVAERNQAARRERTKSFVKKLVILLVVLLVLNVVFDQQFVRYSEQTIAEPYKSQVDEYFNDNPLRKSKLFYNNEDLESYIIGKRPEVSSFKADLNFIGQDKFVVTKKQTSFIWNANSGSFLGDPTGVIYEAASNQPPENMPQIQDRSGIEPKLGEKVISPSALSYIYQIDRDMSKSGLTPKSYVVPNAAREIHVLVNEADYYVKFSLDRPVAGQLDELTDIVGYLKKSGKTISKYLDLRTQDKSYYQ